jgi:transposase
MVEQVRAGKSMHAVARQFRVSVSTVALWVERCRARRMDRAELGDRRPGRAWNRLSAGRERRILEIRRRLRERSVLGEYGARAIAAELQRVQQPTPSVRTINRVLRRHGALDGARRQRRPAPPKGWHLPLVAAGRADIDCFDFIEDLKIADGPLVSVLTGKSLHAVLSDAWVMDRPSAKATVSSLLQRWRRDGLPAYAQFDNDTLFQGAHQFRDSVGRVSRLCLALGVTPVFVPPLEHGMQNTIESFNALWQAKVWQRYRMADLRDLQARSARYIEAHRARHRSQSDTGPARQRMPRGFLLDLQAPLRGTLIYIRRTDEDGFVNVLGHRWRISGQWLHRLVRCEVDFHHHVIRCFGLRRADPQHQPLLATLPYRRPTKRFLGAS